MKGKIKAVGQRPRRKVSAHQQAEGTPLGVSEDLQLINLINDAANKGYSLTRIIQLVAQQTRKAFSCGGATFYGISGDKQYLVTQNLTLPRSAASQIEKLTGAKLAQVRIRLRESSLYLKALRAGKPQLINDQETIQKLMAECTENRLLKRMVPSIQKFLGIKSVMQAPIISGGEVIGLLDISRKTPFTRLELGRFSTIAQQLSPIIGRKRAEEALQVEKNKLQSLIDAMEYGLTIQDKDYKILYQNEPLRAIFGDHVGDKCYRVYESQDKLCDGCPVEKAFQDGKSHTSERRVILPSGEVTYWENTATPARDAKSKITSCLEITRNITERKQAEEELRESNRRFTDIAENAVEWLWETDADGRYTYVSPVVEKILGYKPEELLNKHFYDLFCPDDREELKKAAFAAFAKKQPFRQFLNRNIHKNGKTVWLLTSGVPILDKKGNLLGYRGADIDITERKQAEEELQAEKDKLQSIINSIEYTISIQDRDYNVLYRSQPSRIDGLYHLGEKCYRAFEDKDEVCEGCQVEKAFRDGKSHIAERKIVTPSGEVVFLENTANPLRDNDGKVVSCLEVSRNITERKQAEEALRQSREELRQMFESVTDGILVVDLHGIITEANQRAAEIHGFSSRDELLGKNALEFVASPDREMVAANMRKALKQGMVRGVEYTLLRADGTEFPGELSTSVLRDVSGKWIGHITIVRDITERKKAEQALERQQAYFQQLFNNSPDAIAWLDTTNRFVNVNKGFETLFGYRAEEIKGRLINDTLVPEDRKEEVASLSQSRLSNEAVRMETVRKRKDGNLVDVSLLAYPIQFGDRAVGSYIIYTDITERKWAEEALQTEKNKLQSLIDAMEYGINILDKDYNIVYQNKLFRGTSGSQVGEKCYRALGGQDRVCDDCPVEKTFKDGKSHATERRVVTPSGEVAFWEHAASPIKDVEGKITSCLELTHDITERKGIEEALRESEERFRSIVESSHAGIMIMDDAYHFIYTNDELCQMSGYSREEIIGQDFRQFLDEESRQLVADRYIRRQRGEELPPRYEFNFIRKDGEKRRVEIISSVIRDSAGKVKTVAQLLDITERKRAEEALRESESKFKNLFERTTDAIFLADAQTGILVDANPAACRMLGLPKEKIVGMHQMELHPPEMVDYYKELFRGHAEKGYAVSEGMVIQRADGSRVPVDISASAFELGGRRIMQGVFRDITARKQAEEELRLRAQILDGATDAIFVHDLDDNFIYVNEAACRTHGYSREEFMKMKLPQMVAPEHAPILASDRQELLAKGHLVTESVHLRKDGSKMPVEIHARTIEMGGGKLFLTVARDITERKGVEEELRLRARMLDSATDAILVHDLDENIVYVNEAACRAHGYTREELLKMKIPQIIVPEKVRGLPALRQETLGKGGATFETTHLRKDGSTMPMDVRSRTIEVGGETLILAVMRDITERKKAEEAERRLQQELYLSRRLAAIGELAAGVAHEINNPLTGVLGFSQRLLRKSTNEQVSRDLEIIHDEAQRAANIVQNLLTFARRRQPKKEYSDINDIVQKALELRSYELQSGNIEVTTNLASSLPKVMVDFPQIQEVFLNIILNAEHVMNETHGGGKLIIKTREIKDYVRISFADDGPGIPSDKIDRVFDPFFTTREDRGGTGLGLSICHGIVTGHEGKIYARSKPGGGTTFFVELPLTPVETPVGRRV